MSPNQASLWFLLIVIVCVAIKEGSSTKCYECSSQSQSGCSWKSPSLKDKWKKDCGKDGICSKTKTKSGVTRSCAQKFKGSGECKGDSVKTCTCSSDYCNGGPVTRGSASLLLATVCTMTLFAFRSL